MALVVLVLQRPVSIIYWLPTKPSKAHGLYFKVKVKEEMERDMQMGGQKPKKWRFWSFLGLYFKGQQPL